MKILIQWQEGRDAQRFRLGRIDPVHTPPLRYGSAENLEEKAHEFACGAEVVVKKHLSELLEVVDNPHVTTWEGALKTLRERDKWLINANKDNRALCDERKQRLSELLEAMQYPQPEWPSWEKAIDAVRELCRRVTEIQADAQKALDERREADKNAQQLARRLELATDDCKKWAAHAQAVYKALGVDNEVAACEKIYRMQETLVTIAVVVKEARS